MATSGVREIYCTLAVRNNKLSSRGSRVYLIIIYGKISCVPCKVILM